MHKLYGAVFLALRAAVSAYKQESFRRNGFSAYQESSHVKTPNRVSNSFKRLSQYLTTLSIVQLQFFEFSLHLLHVLLDPL